VYIGTISLDFGTNMGCFGTKKQENSADPERNVGTAPTMKMNGKRILFL